MAKYNIQKEFFFFDSLYDFVFHGLLQKTQIKKNSITVPWHLKWFYTFGVFKKTFTKLQKKKKAKKGIVY